VVVLQAAPRPHPDLPRVPVAIDLARTEESRQFVEIGIHAESVIARVYALPPGTPKEQVQVLRDAFRATLRDPAFRADAERAGLGVAPVSGEEVERIVGRFLRLDPDVLARLRSVLLD
jgi:hypothetical protein